MTVRCARARVSVARRSEIRDELEKHPVRRRTARLPVHQSRQHGPIEKIMIRLVGPGGAGKSTTGSLLAARLGVRFVDLDACFGATMGDVSKYIDSHGYDACAASNVHLYADIIRGAASQEWVLALSSGFMTYREDVHPAYAHLRREIAASLTTFVLLPSLDLETCVAETVRRQLGRPFSRSAEREEQVIRARLAVHRDLPATPIETMRPIADVVDAVVASIAPHQGAALDALRG